MNKEMTFGLLGRILARYVSGALIMKGVLDAQSAAQIASDGALQELITAAIGAVVGGATEAFYWLARKLGWAK
jgi:uncharacterized membrane protein YeaQ/YmgE (transglycosylase-associated protein family)